MQGNLAFFRGVLGIAALIAGFASCTGNGSQSGRTPAPSQTTLAQANSTAAPDAGTAAVPTAHVFAVTGTPMRGLRFSIFVNGVPSVTVNGAKQRVDFTKDARSGANTLVVRWKKDVLSGLGSIVIRQQGGKPLLALTVKPSDPKLGQKSVIVKLK